MKKYSKLGVCCLLLICVFTFIGCGVTKKTASGNTKETATMNKDGRYTSVNAYLNSDLVQNQLQQTLKSYENSMLSIDVTAEGDKLIYNYTYKTLEKADGMAETLNTGLEQQKDTFVAIAKELKQNVSVDSPSVVIRYLDCNKVVITERTFTPND